MFIVWPIIQLPHPIRQSLSCARLVLGCHIPLIGYKGVCFLIFLNSAHAQFATGRPLISLRSRHDFMTHVVFACPQTSSGLTGPAV